MAAKTKISELGDRIAVDNLPEKRIPALGNGSLKAGAIVGINGTTGKVQVLKPGTTELGCYIIEGRYDTPIDDAITDGLPLTLIVPTSGHKYRTFMADQGASKDKGQAMKVETGTGGMLTANTNWATAGTVGGLSLPIVDDDLVCEVEWA